MNAPEVIYLQCEEDDLPYNWEDTTWCSDKINEYDVKYIRATPENMAAPELLAALKDMLSGWKYIRHSHGDLYGVGWDRAQEAAEAAIAKAEGKS